VKSTADPEDLSAHARRGAQSLDEARELVRALDASATLRVAHRVGLDLDRATQVRAGDEDLILAAADAALLRGVPRPPGVHLRASSRKPPRKIAAALVAAAMISASGMAAAWWTGIAKVPFLGVTSVPSLEAPDVPARRTHSVKRRTPPPEVVPAASAQPEAPVAPVTSTDEPAVVEAASTPETSVHRPQSRATAEPTAAALFSGANAARRAGDFAGARRVYARLISKYPDSDEARLSQVSLGKLLLASGDAVEAEREFRHYLSNGHQPLAEEARVSQAESFRAMNHRAEERRAWATLLAEHPNSVYAARARARLSALDHDETTPGP
jgi:TolA-binding protein